MISERFAKSPMSATSTPSSEQAVIYVGAASLSMVIGSTQENGGFREVEHLDRPLPMARDIFRTTSKFSK